MGPVAPVLVAVPGMPWSPVGPVGPVAPPAPAVRTVITTLEDEPCNVRDVALATNTLKKPPGVNKNVAELATATPGLRMGILIAPYLFPDWSAMYANEDVVVVFQIKEKDTLIGKVVVVLFWNWVLPLMRTRPVVPCVLTKST